MHCHCGTNNRVPRWTFMDTCKPEVRPGAREESASPAWLAAPGMNALDTTKVRFPVETHIFILNLSPVSRSSQLGKTHTNEMKDDIHQE